jgi:transcriptional regulator with XRE-family HTH domain
VADPSKNPNTLDQLLKAEQRRRGVNQTQAAELVGVSKAVYSRWCTGSSLPSISNVGAVADFVGLSTVELVDLFPSSYSQRGVLTPFRDFVAMVAQIDQLTIGLDEMRAIVAALAAGDRVAPNSARLGLVEPTSVRSARPS